MITVTATQFRAALFEYLDKVASGETIIIQRHNQQVARLTPMETVDWRTKMTQTVQLNVSEDELIAPLEDVWEEYT